MYYPLSQITSNLHTNGREFVIKSTNSPYSGYYWKTSKGQYFTGKTPQDIPIQELIPITSLNPNSAESPLYTELFLGSNDVIEYTSVSLPFKQTQLPTYSPTFPTSQDYQVGEFRRYFCKKTNELIYLEISKDTYTKLVNKDSQILYQLYFPFNIPWQLTGDKTQVYKTNKNIVELTMFRNKLSMFDKYIKEDYTKYYLS